MCRFFCGCLLRFGVIIIAVEFAQPGVWAEDYFLTIAGGYSRSGNQVSFEKNVLFYQRLLNKQKLHNQPNDIFFADGFSKEASLQVRDPDSLPLANRLMAEFFGSQRNLGLQYRPHQVPNIRGQTSVENIDLWFKENAPKMNAGDRLILYVSAHGGKSADSKRPHNTTIYLWNNKKLSVSELASYLDQLPEGVAVVTFMVQCHAGGFAQLFNEHGDPSKEFARQNRCGFFATVQSRPAAGCTPEINEENYEEYSTYFFAALAGENRLGQEINLPDYNHDGIVSFDEAHAYTVLSANTIDLPIKTSGEYLRKASEFGNENNSSLLSKDASFETVWELAGTADRAVLKAMSEQLELTGSDRIAKARKSGSRRTRSTRRGGQSSSQSRRSRGAPTELQRLKRSIANDIKKRWPDLANTLNPISIELVTTRQGEFIESIENHKEYPRYRELADQSTSHTTSEKSKVKFERFVRTAENVILAENLERLENAAAQNAYQRILEAESGSLASRKRIELRSSN